jgi:hypothetical protein
MREGPEPVRASRFDPERAVRLVRRCVDLDRRGAPTPARLAALDQARAAVARMAPGRSRERLATVCDILADLQRDDTAEAVRAAILRARAALDTAAGT